MPIEVNGKSFETDEEGYLADLSLWERDLATAMAKEDDLSVDVKVIDSSEMKKLITDSEVIFNF